MMEELSSRLGYVFSDGKLLKQALTHRSYGSPNNERLEFIGDSVLNCVVAVRLFLAFPGLTEGELSRLRANLVNQQSLCELAFMLELGRFLLLGEGEVRSDGHRRPSILADAMEAVFGAIFLDGGFDSASSVIGTLYEKPISEIDPNAQAKDPKTRLQEYLQGKRIALPKYHVVETSGEAHRQRFLVECAIPELNVRSTGEGASRRSAEQSAALEAYRIIAGS